MPSEKPKFYLTTPIYYVNARPHIGHAYTTIVADVLARRHRLLGDETFFLTGTDEHGQKIERSAAAAGIPPQQFTDQVAAEFKTLWDRMGITYDKFIRTTSPEHAAGVQKLWRELEARGFIYLSSYTGSYCVSDEAFVDAPAGTPCPDCGRLLETVTEENYFFKLSKFQLPLLDLIESGELKIENEARKNEVLSFLRGDYSNILTEYFDQFVKERAQIGSSENTDISEAVNWGISQERLKKSHAGFPYLPNALRDLSISRSSFKWGIPVPDESHARSGAAAHHVIYVWLDALANYITALGYGSDDESNFEKFWPADLHLVGKEIIRFHCVYWPAFLLALNPKLTHKPEENPPILSPEEHAAWAEKWVPKKITAHGWLLFDNSKMSKSKGNIVRTETILDAFGTLCPLEPQQELVARVLLGPKKPSPKDLFASDVLRYFLLREIPFGYDGSFSFDALWERYNADLVNGYGNLVSRTLNLISQNEPNGIEKPTSFSAEGTSFIKDGVSQVARYPAHLSSNEITAYVTEMILLVGHVDRYLSTHAPWKLAKETTAEARQTLVEVLYTSAEAIRLLTIFLHPIMPYATTRVWTQLGLDPAELTTHNAQRTTLLTWGGLKPGTKLGPLSPIFPRADKSLIEIMTNMENETTPSAPSTSAPDAAPRTTSLPETAAALSVGGSTALTAAPTTSEISIDDFAKIELRVAQIVVAERIPKADKLLRLEVDLGPGFPRRQILSGIAEWYTPEELIGRRIVVITNLAPRKMRGLESHGMLLAASSGENGKPILATFAEDIALGSRLK